MAVVRREVSDRTLFGKIIKWVFILFNILMLVWLVGGFSAASQHVGNATSEAARAGAAIGTALGVGMIMTIWVMGDVIIGILVLLTRRKKVIETEE